MLPSNIQPNQSHTNRYLMYNRVPLGRRRKAYKKDVKRCWKVELNADGDPVLYHRPNVFRGVRDGRSRPIHMNRVDARRWTPVPQKHEIEEILTAVHQRGHDGQHRSMFHVMQQYYILDKVMCYVVVKFLLVVKSLTDVMATPIIPVAEVI